MTREQLEHVIRAAAAITNERSFVVVGSQAVLLPYPDAHPDLLVSRELDLYPAMAPDKSDLIEGAIGALSQFDETFGYYADGVSPETAVMPSDWMSRASLHYLGDTTVVCPDMHDLAVSKCVARREKDGRFLAVMFKEEMISFATLEQLIRRLDPTHPIESIVAWARRHADEAI
ncbi:MAG: hypothetical protein H7Y61_02185 [Rhizobiales bacterium]|nr:hypothetical protein [Rhizobacter sp.]